MEDRTRHLQTSLLAGSLNMLKAVEEPHLIHGEYSCSTWPVVYMYLKELEWLYSELAVPLLPFFMYTSVCLASCTSTWDSSIDLYPLPLSTINVTNVIKYCRLSLQVLGKQRSCVELRMRRGERAWD